MGSLGGILTAVLRSLVRLLQGFRVRFRVEALRLKEP